MNLSWRPDHAYVPGRTARHPEDLFDPFKQIADPLEASLAWQMGLALFREGYFWEAHEVWEALWLAAPPNRAERCVVQGLIQEANARLKARMERPKAAQRLHDIARAQLGEGFRRQSGATVLALTQAEAFQLLL